MVEISEKNEIKNKIKKIEKKITVIGIATAIAGLGQFALSSTNILFALSGILTIFLGAYLIS